MWNDFFYYRRGERIALVILLVLLVTLFVGVRFLPDQDVALWSELRADSGFLQSCDSFFQTLSVDSAFRRNYPLTSRQPPVLAYFDPNTTDSSGFVKLGLSGWVARNIIRYRAKGGVFYKPEQFARIYGIDSLQFRQLADYIRIDTARLKKPVLSYQRDSAAKRFPEKFTELTMVELNSADTSLLQKIPGIGSGFAAMVVNLRKQLGGFYSVGQLKELRGVSDSLYAQWEPWFYVDVSLIRPLPVNEVGITRLRNHPYLDFYQAKAIVELRKQYGWLNGWRDLSLLEEFSSEDIERLKPYLHFGDQ